MGSCNPDDSFNFEDSNNACSGASEINVLTTDEPIHIGNPDEEYSISSASQSASLSRNIHLNLDENNLLEPSETLNANIHVASQNGFTFLDKLNEIMHHDGVAATIDFNSSHIDGYNETLTEIKTESKNVHDINCSSQNQSPNGGDVPLGCTGCATKCLHTCFGICKYSCSGSCESYSHK